MNVEDHYVNVLSKISTRDLIAELEQRDKVSINESDAGEIQIIYPDVSLGKIVDHIDGPAKIIVVWDDIE